LALIVAVIGAALRRRATNLRLLGLIGLDRLRAAIAATERVFGD
jgi:hypothetical protein